MSGPQGGGFNETAFNESSFNENAITVILTPSIVSGSFGSALSVSGSFGSSMTVTGGFTALS